MACVVVPLLRKAQASQGLWIFGQAPARVFSRGRPALEAQNFSDYESMREQYQPDVPEYFNFAKDVLEKWATMEKEGRGPSSPALWWVSDQGEEVRWSFAELVAASKKAANVLSEQCGLRKGDRVIVLLSRIPEWWLLNVACMRTGTVLIPGTTQLTSRDILHRLRVSQAKCVITDQVLAPAVDSVASQCPSLAFRILVSRDHRDGWLSFCDLLNLAPADHDCVATRSSEPMAVYFTSGTTGAPKMVEHSHGSQGIGLALNGSLGRKHTCAPKSFTFPQGHVVSLHMLCTALGSVIHSRMNEQEGMPVLGLYKSFHTLCDVLDRLARYWLDLTPQDLIWNTSDTGWAKSAWSSVFSPWSQGAGVFAHSMPRFEPESVLETLSRFPITTFCSAPTAYRMLIRHRLSSYHFPSLKHCVSAGEPMNPELMEDWKRQTGLQIYEGYGQTETVLICGTFKGMKIKPGSMGKPSPAYDTQIIDEDGNIVPPGKEGDIAIRIKPTRPFSLFTQYTEDPEKTASTIRGSYYITGDRGIRDQEGYFWFVGRADDVINSAGYRIGPFEVESALTEHPAVVESAVVSSPDSLRGEVVKAFVVLAPDYVSHDPDVLIKELQDHVKKATAPYKYPRRVEFVPHLPKTVSGKIRRNELRKKEWGGA
ncbi:acyl-coenzyme A synthetase ACSM3, mitochondrial-like isoform X1 [Paroedura picta]|uniref:acyl-coenzyme A synthetase ACSM3, mitochondrial-like isoform X1 n=1 Tax=Paroedura picta TaxID=143630 RepID=UPI004057C77E